MNMNTKSYYQNAQSYMCKYPLEQQKTKTKKGYLLKIPVLHVEIPSTTTKNINTKTS